MTAKFSDTEDCNEGDITDDQDERYLALGGNTGEDWVMFNYRCLMQLSTGFSISMITPFADRLVHGLSLSRVCKQKEVDTS